MIAGVPRSVCVQHVQSATMIDWDTSLGHFRGPDAARGRCLNLDWT